MAELLYVVKSGDNPAPIARQFGVKTEDLMAYNHIDNPQKLQIGQTLKIPPPPASNCFKSIAILKRAPADVAQG